MSAESSHKLIVVPGFNGTEKRLNFFREAMKPWEQHGITSIVFPVQWHESDHFTHLDRLGNMIEAELEDGSKVSLLGASAGGVLAINAFAENPQINKVVTVSSRLTSAKYTGYIGMDDIRAVSPASAEGIALLEAHQKDALPESLRLRIMNTRAFLGDDQVHPSTSFLKGAENVWMPPVKNHIHAVSSALTIESGVIIDFLKKD